MSPSYTEEFQSNFMPDIFPEELTKRFSAVSCLSDAEFSQTFLLAENKTGQFYVLKRYLKNAPFHFLEESGILFKLAQEGLPKYVCDYADHQHYYIIRTYIEGITLQEYIEQNQIHEKTAVSMMIDLCKTIAYLHAQQPPIIHRDVKPTNIIIDPKEPQKLTLIDFGIARLYHEEADKDTVSFGTKTFAPPEQFGYAQTDSRTDIYAAGATLAYMLTKKTDLQDALSLISNKSLRQILQKATAFAPSERFRTVDAFSKKLRKIDLHPIKNTLLYFFYMLLLTGIFMGGAYYGRYTKIKLPFEQQKEQSIVFHSAVIENAVRSVLGKTNGEPILQDELLSVKELFIFGEEPLSSKEQFNQVISAYLQQEIAVRRADLSNLKDLALLPELISLHLAYTNLTNLSGIESCNYITNLEIKFSPITDISALAELPLLSDLSLDLQNLNDISRIGDINQLKRLALANLPIRTLEGLEECDQLTELFLLLHSLTDVSALYNMPALGSLIVDANMNPQIIQKENFTFDITYLD